MNFRQKFTFRNALISAHDLMMVVAALFVSCYFCFEYTDFAAAHQGASLLSDYFCGRLLCLPSDHGKMAIHFTSGRRQYRQSVFASGACHFGFRLCGHRPGVLRCVLSREEDDHTLLAVTGISSRGHALYLSVFPL